MSYHSSSSCKSGGIFQIISSHSIKRGVKRKMLPSQFFFDTELLAQDMRPFEHALNWQDSTWSPWECLPCLVAVTLLVPEETFSPKETMCLLSQLASSSETFECPITFETNWRTTVENMKMVVFSSVFWARSFEKSHASLLRARSMWALCVDICLSLIRSWCSQRCETGEWLGGVEQVVSPPSWCGDEKEAKLSWVFGPVLEALQSG